jgi:predicted kinase
MEAVIFIGIPGSGKTTFFRERFFDGYMRISKDLLRTRHREQVFLHACLSTQQRFVVDNTNVLAAERRLYIPQARAANFRVIGYIFDTSLKDALRRNAQRQGKAIVPAAGVIAKYKRWQRPESNEGFDELFSVSIDRESKFVISSWPQYDALDSAGRSSV